MKISSIANSYPQSLQRNPQFNGNLMHSVKRGLLPTVMLAGSLLMSQSLKANNENYSNDYYDPIGEYYQGHIDFSKISTKDWLKMGAEIVGLYGGLFLLLGIGATIINGITSKDPEETV